MKTHDLARILRQLAEVLRAGPNIQLKDARMAPIEEDGGSVRLRDIAVNLTTLAELSRLKKSEWQAVITHYSLPVETKVSDSTRDLLGRLLKYLEQNPEERERIRKEAAPSATEASPELLRAFKVLLNE